MSWYITGQAGAALDDTRRSLESLNFDTATLKQSSLDDDVLEWTAQSTDAKGSGSIVPDISQVVELWWDDVRKFRGHVVIPRVGWQTITIVARGPWWWMTQIQLTSHQLDANGNSGERVSYVFPTQDLKTSMEALIDRAITNGVPMVRGTVDPMFVWPRITLSERSCAQALADLMNIVPDAVAWFDYSGPLPALNISRRGAMQNKVYQIGQDPITDIDLFPRLEQQVQYIDVQSVQRDATTGKPSWVRQSSGTPTVGKNQLVVVSGPEPNAFLPKDKFDTFQVKTFGLPTGGTALGTLTTSSSHSATFIIGDPLAFVLANDESIATLIREFGSTLSNALVLSNGGRYLTSLYTTGITTGAHAFNMDKPNLVAKEDPIGLNIVSSADRVPEWANLENGYTVRQATFTSYVRLTRDNQTVDPSWWSEVVLRAMAAHVGYKVGYTSTAGYYQYNAFFKSSIPVTLISGSFPTLTTLYRQWDYDYLNPSEGLAAELLAAQNWVPWEGRIVTVERFPATAYDLSTKYSVINSLPDCADMGALPKAVTLDLHRQRKILDLGSPARVDFGTLADRFRSHPKDNIEMI